MDSIGLGNAMVNTFYLILWSICFLGVAIMIKKKIFLAIFVWVSLVSNIFSHYFFMGNYRYYTYVSYDFINKIWPIINLLLILVLIISHIRNKRAKNK